MTHTIYKTIEIGGKTRDQYQKELAAKKIYISSYAQDLLNAMELASEKETIELVKMTLKDMGLTGYPTTDQIFQKAKELGLELCPPEVGPALRLRDDTNEWILIGMQPIFGRDRDPSVFLLDSGGAGLELYAATAEPARLWDSDDEWVFRLRKSDTGTLAPLDSFGPSDSLTLRSDKYTEMLEWLYLNTGNQLSNEMKKKLLDKFAEILK